MGHEITGKNISMKRAEKKSLKMVFKLSGNMVVALDASSQQSPAHQGHYRDVKQKILRDADEKTRFFQEDAAGDLVRVTKKQWGQNR